MSESIIVTLFNPTLPFPLDWLPLAFRLIAAFIGAPFLFIMLIEVAGYLVVRTLGFHFRVPVTRDGNPVDPSLLTPAPKSEVTSAASSPVLTVKELPSDSAPPTTTQRRPPPPKLNLPPPSSKIGPPPAYFATPGEHSFSLSGLFSPPQSRPPSPSSITFSTRPESASEAEASLPSPTSSSDSSLKSPTLDLKSQTLDVGRSDGSEIRNRHAGMRRGFVSMTPIEAR